MNNINQVTLEAKCAAQLQSLYQEKNITVTQVVNALNKGTITEKNLTTIMHSGAEEFKEATGRNMSYGELRELYG